MNSVNLNDASHVDIVQEVSNASGIDFESNTQTPALNQQQFILDISENRVHPADEMDVENAEADLDFATATASQSADLPFAGPFVGQQHTLTTVAQNDNVFNVANGESVEDLVVKCPKTNELFNIRSTDWVEGLFKLFRQKGQKLATLTLANGNEDLNGEQFNTATDSDVIFNHSQVPRADNGENVHSNEPDDTRRLIGSGRVSRVDKTTMKRVKKKTTNQSLSTKGAEYYENPNTQFSPGVTSSYGHPVELENYHQQVSNSEPVQNEVNIQSCTSGLNETELKPVLRKFCINDTNGQVPTQEDKKRLLNSGYPIEPAGKKTREKKTREAIGKYKCLLCPRTFNQKQSLTRHYGLHLGYKTAVCKICKAQDSREDRMRDHLKTKHDVHENNYTDNYDKLECVVYIDSETKQKKQINL